MATYYTTPSIVKESLKVVELHDDIITGFIEQAESIVEAILGSQFGRAGFSAPKWGILRRLATNLACIQCLAYDTTAYATTSMAALTADIFWAMIEQDIKFLSDKRIVEYLKAAT